MRRSTACALLALSLAACRPPETPADAYRRFAAALHSPRPDVVQSAWDMLSAGSRQALDARARRLAEGAPGVVSPSGRDLLPGAVSRTAPRVKSVTVKQESATAAVVAVEDEGGGRGEVQLVREGEAWKVVLPLR
ncbi:MAG: hypothetical protein QM767_25385 [Anaeromyxobacter sp.]